ncbi:winged helix-turn-helix transcriptional regulator [Rhizobium sp. 2YAF20]|uniref:winged helix-turn-helix transcriptional regulator n=1 Tax=Rhizobium sp. 2YAF20 TaxID=3233027 RepID=UPI003F9D8762
MTGQLSDLSNANPQLADVFDPQCPSRAVLDHITSKWGVLTLVALLPGTLRFNQIRRKLSGVSERMLAQTLQNLVADGLVDRKSLPVVPPHVEYTLTAIGKEAGHHVEALAGWAERMFSETSSPPQNPET